jgi:antirestriction protein ArdC
MTKAKELKESLNAAIDKLIDAIESEQVTDELKAYAVQAGKFTRYSLHNQILIMMQDPEATQVAGYKAWNKFDRHVMKGEHGIGILAPHQFTSVNDKGAEEDRLGFHATTVFDVRQTDGEPMVDPTHVTGDGGESLYDALSEYSHSVGMDVRLDAIGSYDGMCTKSEIVINDSLSMQGRVGVLVHEIAHHLAGHHGSDKSVGMREWEAETVSFVFCEKFGIENKAPQYLKGWGATRDNIKASLGTISKVSSQIIKAVEAV